MRGDWPIVAAAWLITLLAATLLAAGPIYSDAVSLAGLRRVMRDAPVTQANIQATAVVPPGEIDFVSTDVDRHLREAIGPVGAEVYRSATSDTYALPVRRGEEVLDLAVLGFAEGIESHARLVEGRWPRTARTGAVEVAAVAPVADELGWRTGEALVLTSRRNDSETVEVRLVGVFSIDDPGDPFWWSDLTIVEGWTESESFRTFAPLLTTPEELLGRVATRDVRVTWHAFPRFDRITLEQVEGLRARVSELPDRLSFALAGSFPTADTGLPAILADVQRSLLVTRTGVLLLVVQLAILAAYAIVLTAGLLAEHRRADTSLLRSRGASPLQVAGMALAEAVVLAAPAAVLAPFVAAAALRVFNVAGPLATAGVEIVPQLSTIAFVVASAAALGAALLLVVPALLAARSFVDEEGRRSRFETRTIGQRLGLDLALLAVTLIGFWQLRLYGAPLTESVQGSLGLDPLLVAAPAIGLLAGGVLALRVVPLLATTAEALTRRGRRLIGALGAQQVARRPLRYTRAALLLMLAVSMGIFAVSYADTWQASQQDQATHQVGADVRLVSTGGGGTVPAWALERAFAAVPGVTAATALDRQFLRASAGSQEGELVALDAANAPAIVSVRGDLAPTPLDSLFELLAGARPTPSLVRLDPVSRRLRVDVRFVADRLQLAEFNAETGDFVFRTRDIEDVPNLRLGAEVVVRDANGLIERFTADGTAWDRAGQSVVIDLQPPTPRVTDAVREIDGGLSGPLEILAVDITVSMPPSSVADRGRLELVGLSASQQASNGGWQPVDLDAAGGWSAFVLRSQGAIAPAGTDQLRGTTFHLGVAGPTGSLQAPLQPGVRPPAVSYVARSLADLADTPLDVVVNDAFLGATSSTVGDTVTARTGGLLRELRVVGVVGAFPTVDPGRPQAIADLGTLGLLAFAGTQSMLTPLEWWISTEPGAGPEVAAALSAGPYVRGAVTSRAERAAALSADPVALGIIGGLSLGFVVAGIFAVVGLAVSAAVSARQRRTEFALLRALGLSSRQLSGWLWLENAAVVAVSLAAGTGLGLLIGWVALPYVTVTQEAAAPFPPPLVRTPWASIAVLVAVSAGALGVTVMVLAGVLRRIGIGSVLRMGED